MSVRDANLLGALAVGLDDALRAALVAASGLDSSAVAALLVVRERSGQPITEMAAALGLTHSGAVRIVDRLEERGLLSRGIGHDGRSRGLMVTEKGRELGDRALAGRRAVLERLLEMLSPHQQSQLTTATEVLLTQLPRTRSDAWRICRTCEHDMCRGTECPVGGAVGTAEVPPS